MTRCAKIECNLDFTVKKDWEVTFSTFNGQLDGYTFIIAEIVSNCSSTLVVVNQNLSEVLYKLSLKINPSDTVRFYAVSFEHKLEDKIIKGEGCDNHIVVPSLSIFLATIKVINRLCSHKFAILKALLNTPEFTNHFLLSVVDHQVVPNKILHVLESQCVTICDKVVELSEFEDYECHVSERFLRSLAVILNEVRESKKPEIKERPIRCEKRLICEYECH
jgi:hypothetical protein